MQSIVDKNGVEWEIVFDIPTVLRLIGKLNITAAQLTVLDFPVSQLGALFPIICERQMRERAVKPEEFLDRFAGVSPGRLRKALSAAWSDAMRDEDAPKVSAQEGERPFDSGAPAT